jgi:hypothetical protein
MKMYLLKKFDEIDDFPTSLAVSEDVDLLKKEAKSHARLNIRWESHREDSYSGYIEENQFSTYSIQIIKCITK